MMSREGPVWSKSNDDPSEAATDITYDLQILPLLVITSVIHKVLQNYHKFWITDWQDMTGATLVLG